MNTTIHITTDSKLKAQAQQLAKEMGLNLTLVLNNLLKDFIQKQSIEFTAERTLSPELEAKWMQDRIDSKDEPEFTNADDLIQYCLTD